MSWKYEGRCIFHLGLYLTTCCADALFYLFLLNMRFGSFLAHIQCVFLPPARSAPGQAPALPMSLIRICSIEQKRGQKHCHQRLEFQWRLIWMLFKWKPGGWFRQARWILTSNQTRGLCWRLRTASVTWRAPRAGGLQITGAAQWITPIMRTSAIYHTRVTPSWSDNYAAAILTWGLPEAPTCFYRHLEMHHAFI